MPESADVRNGVGRMPAGRSASHSTLVGRVSSDAGELDAPFVHGANDVLDGVNRGFVEIAFAALRANPSGYIVEADVNIFAVNVKGRMSLDHRTLAVHAFHGFSLVLNSSAHWPESGI